MNAEVYMQVKDDEAANREPASFGETKSEVESGLSTNTHLIPSFNMTSIEGHIKLHPNHRTPIGGRGPRLLWLLCAEGSESMLALSPLPAPSELLNLLRCNCIASPRRMARNWLPHTPRRRWSTIPRWTHVAIWPIWWRRPAISSSKLGARGIAW